MRFQLVLALSLLVLPGLLAPAQGADVSVSECVGPSCLRIDAGPQGARGVYCFDDAGCASASACPEASCAEVSGCASAADASTCASVAPCSGEAAACPEAVPCVGCPETAPVVGANVCSGTATSFSFRLFSARLGAGGSAAGTPDTLWRVVRYPAFNNENPPSLSGGAYSRGVDPLPGAWVSDPASAWINPFSDRSWGPSGAYVYEARYAIPANAYGVTLAGRYAVDNRAVVSDTNTTQATVLSTSAVDAFRVWTNVTAAPLSSGAHTLTVSLTNDHTNSFTGANLQFTVAGSCRVKVPVVGTSACSRGATEFRFALSTGLGPDGQPLPNGGVDAHWNAGGSTPTAATSRGQNPLPGAWVTDPSSSWISRFAGPEGYTGLSGPAGQYDYSVRYTLPVNAVHVQVVGKVAADNNATLRDIDAAQSTTVATTPTPEGFRAWTPFAYNVTRTGMHTLAASVYNFGGPTGLNVVVEVSGRCVPVVGLDACRGGAKTFLIPLNTGLDAQNQPTQNGQMDAHWTSGGVTPSAAQSRGQDPLPGVWVTDPASSWIGPATNLSANVPTTAAAGYFDYAVRYQVPVNAYDVKVNGRVAADNRATVTDTDASQMATLVAQTPSPYGFRVWTPFSYNVTSVGAHTFAATVYNEGSHTGLNVVASVTGRCRYDLVTREVPSL